MSLQDSDAEAFTLQKYPSAFICITAFAYSGSSLPPLNTVVDSVHRWKIAQIQLTLLTQDDASILKVQQSLGAERIGRWAAPRRMIHTVAPPKRVNNVLLPWYHRELMAAVHGKFSLYGYLEHDIDMHWEHVVAWARDEERLRRAAPPAPGLPWRRGFWRWYHRYQRGGSARASDAPIDNSTAPPLRFFSDGNPCRPEHGLSLKVCRCHDAARWPPNRAGCVVRSVVVDAGTSTT